jgi:deoxyribonuclease V
VGGITSPAANRRLDAAEATFFGDVQKILFKRKQRLPKVVSRICSVDAAYRDDDVVAVASLFEDGRLLDEACYRGKCSLPYVSGLFYLLEGPFVTEAVRRLSVRPQLVCFDAHGAAHPRSAGLATTCGMVLGIPSVGIAKSLLVGRVVRGEGGLDSIEFEGETVGFVSHDGGVARYWSPGYSVSLRELRSLIERYAPVCLIAMAEADRAAGQQLRGRPSSSRPPL